MEPLWHWCALTGKDEFQSTSALVQEGSVAMRRGGKFDGLEDEDGLVYFFRDCVLHKPRI